jgi:hypothetical protein
MMIYSPTVAELEAQVNYLKDQLLTTRMHLRVARKAAKRRQEGPMLPFMEPPAGSGSLPVDPVEAEATA